MDAVTRQVASFPSLRLPSVAGGAPVEVVLITQLGIGAGNRVVREATGRQAAHGEFIDALDEPSARLGAMHLQHGDASSLYSFTVGQRGHPFHRHATPRTFTAISGSSGAQLRFSTVADADLVRDPAAFVRALRLVDIPPDCVFTVRFGGSTWHQFVPRHRAHPALFALSCHTNELGGDLSGPLRARVEANAATIPALTDVLPDNVQALLDQTDLRTLPTVALALHAAPGSFAARACALTRHITGRLRIRWGRMASTMGYVTRRESSRVVTSRRTQPADSLIEGTLPRAGSEDDCAEVMLSRDEVGGRSASQVLAGVLEGFLVNRPAGVSRLMALRNVAVAPLRLRTSPLGCPVSSLLSDQRELLFANRFPVLAQRVSSENRTAQVLLGADDRHLTFRSCVHVSLQHDGHACIRLGTRVRKRNAFGRFYMAAIDAVHRRYIAPSLLRMAADHAAVPEITIEPTRFALSTP